MTPEAKARQLIDQKLEQVDWSLGIQRSLTHLPDAV